MTKTERLCVEFCNYVQYHIYLNYFNSILSNLRELDGLVISRRSCIMTLFC
jgi:hypothetical protein